MGYIYSARCDCGYGKDSVRVGGGMLNFRTYDPFPHYCPKCKILFEGNLAAENTICCPECDTDEVIPYFDQKMCDCEEYKSREFHPLIDKRLIRIRKYLCPNCNMFNLIFGAEAVYD